MRAEPSHSPWVSESWLVRTVPEVSIVNSGTKTKAATAGGVEIVELESSGVELRVPQGICSEGHVLSLQFFLKQKPTGKTLFRVVATGKVDRVSRPKEGFCEIHIRFYQIDDGAWTAFARHLSDRQNRASAYLDNRQE